MATGNRVVTSQQPSPQRSGTSMYLNYRPHRHSAEYSGITGDFSESPCYERDIFHEHEMAATTDSSSDGLTSEGSSDTFATEATSDTTTSTPDDWVPHVHVDALARLEGNDDASPQNTSSHYLDTCNWDDSSTLILVNASSYATVLHDGRFAVNRRGIDTSEIAAMNATLRAGNAAQRRRVYDRLPAARSQPTANSCSCFMCEVRSRQVVPRREVRAEMEERHDNGSRSMDKIKNALRGLRCF